jgi:hypothetical protein
MPALAGDHVVVKMDDSGGTLRTFDAGDIISVDLGQSYDQHDVTGFGDTVHKVINGQLKSPITLKGYLTTTATTGTHTVIRGALSGQTQVTVEVQIGNNAAPTTGDPKFTGEFYIASYAQSIAPGGAITFTATLNPAIGVGTGIPVWGTV